MVSEPKDGAMHYCPAQKNETQKEKKCSKHLLLINVKEKKMCAVWYSMAQHPFNHDKNTDED